MGGESRVQVKGVHPTTEGGASVIQSAVIPRGTSLIQRPATPYLGPRQDHMDRPTIQGYLTYQKKNLRPYRRPMPRVHITDRTQHG